MLLKVDVTWYGWVGEVIVWLCSGRVVGVGSGKGW